MKNTILKILSVVGGFFTAVFYFLYKQKKDENKIIKNAYENTRKQAEEENRINKALNEQLKTSVEENKKNETIKKDIFSNNASNSLNAINSVLR